MTQLKNTEKSIIIPKGWMIKWNHLCSINPATATKDVFEENRFNFPEDIAYFVFETDNKKYSVDIGFYPEFSYRGGFAVYLIQDGDWNNPLDRIDTKDLNELVEKTNALLNKIAAENQ